MKADLTPILLGIERARFASCSSFELLKQYHASRDEGAFRALVEREGPTVHAICYGESLSGEIALEAFQETFLELVRRGHMIRDEAKLGAWMRQVARRTARRMIRRDRDRRRVEIERAREFAVLPDDTLAAIEQSSRVWREVRLLPDRYRTPLELRYLAGMSPPEIARRLGVPEKTVKTRLMRGLKKLRPALRRLGLGAAALGTTDVVIPQALAAGTAGLVAGAVRESGALRTTFVGLWPRWRWLAVSFLLAVGVGVGVAVGVAIWPRPVAAPLPPATVVVVESLPEKNLRLLRAEVMPRVLPAVRTYLAGDGELHVVEERATDSQVICELEGKRRTADEERISRMRLNYCVLVRELMIWTDMGATGRWKRIDPKNPLILAQWGGAGNARKKISFRLPFIDELVNAFDRLPTDDRAVAEITRSRYARNEDDIPVIPANYRWITGNARSLFVGTGAGLILKRESLSGGWTCIGTYPGHEFAATDRYLFCPSWDGQLLARPISDEDCDWQPLGPFPYAHVYATTNRLYARAKDGHLWTRSAEPVADEWKSAGAVPAPGSMTGWHDRLIGQEGGEVVQYDPRGTGPAVRVTNVPYPSVIAVWGDRMVLWRGRGEELYPLHSRKLTDPKAEWQPFGRVAEER